MAKKTVIAGSTVSAQQLKDFFRQVAEGSIGHDHLQAFLDRRNPFEPAAKPKVYQFATNEHGHIVLTITGRTFTGAAEIARLESFGFRVSDYARQCLLSTRSDSYDSCHRLEEGKEYKIVLMPTLMIGRDSERSAKALQEVGAKLGYANCRGGIVTSIRELVSDEQMERMGFQFIVGSHSPIKDSGGNPDLLNADRYDDGSWLRAPWDYPGGRWRGGGAFAFLLPAS